MVDLSWAAAEERAREARRAGLQAKKDEQPANTTKSYTAKQREWRKWCQTPRAGPDGTLYTWPDGELVTPDKLAAWLKEDILLRRMKVARRRPAKVAETLVQVEALLKAQILAETLGELLGEAVRILCEDQEDYIPLSIISQEEEEEEEGTLFTRNTVDAYVAAVMELWRVQVAHGSKNTDNPRRATVRGFLEQRGWQRARQDCESY